MAVGNLTAEPNPRGGQIDLAWTNPTLPTFTGVKIFRRESTFPDLTKLSSEHEIRDDSSHGTTGQFSDANLKGETVYYYAVVTYDSGAVLSVPALASAMATTTYESGASLYGNLPAIYPRYDAVTDVPSLDPGDTDKGPLRRFLEMFGLQFDLLRSFAGGMRSFSDIDRIDGALLPLLAQWIASRTDSTITLAKQRNEIKYAPHYYRTTGVAANLRATINRYTTFDAQIKEFVHNIFLSNDPERLTIWESERHSTVWTPAQLVTLDVAHEGRPVALRTGDGRQWLVYHARQSIPPAGTSRGQTLTGSEWHLWYKIRDQGDWQAAQRLTYAGDINKYPAVFQRSAGSLWLFWSRYEPATGGYLPQIQLSVLAAGAPARAARLQGTQPSPWAFTDGDEFVVTSPVAQVVTFHDEDFIDPSHATAAEVVAVLNRELPGVEVTAAADATIILTSLSTGGTGVIAVSPSIVATRLGLGGPATGNDAVAAEVKGEAVEPFALSDNDTLILTVDGRPIDSVIFHIAPPTPTDAPDFVDITHAAATEVVAVINRAVPGLARVDAGKITLTSPTSGEASLVAVSVNESSAAPKLGFGVPVPSATAAADDTEPAACEDGSHNVWLFWTSRRSGAWKIWYNRFDGTTWGAAQPLTTGLEPDREPAVLFDPSGGGTLWVFWSRQQPDGSWNIFFRTIPALTFPLPGSADTPLTAPPAGADNKEPAPILLGAGSVELYFSSNRTDGWHVWSKTLTSTTQGVEVQVNTGPFTQRAPAALPIDAQTTYLWFRSNESLTYTSAFYPASTTIDGRYCGSTSIDTRSAAKIASRAKLSDALHYTYDTRKDDANWYARDTVGIYLKDNGTLKPVVPNIARIGDIVRQFLPIQVRAVLILEDK